MFYENKMQRNVSVSGKKCSKLVNYLALIFNLNIGMQERQSRHHNYPGQNLNQTKSMQKIPSTILEPIMSSGCTTKYNVGYLYYHYSLEK